MVNDRLPKYHISLPVLLLCLALCFVGIFGRDLWTPDEHRVAAISLEMSRTGNVIIPHLAGEPFVEKPPLYFAVAAGFIRLIGSVMGNTGAIRLTSALWGLGALGMTFLLVKRITGRENAILATVILATMVGFIENMHWIRVDAALFFFVVASVRSFAEVYIGGRPWHLLAAGLFSAAAFLSKGMIGPVFIGVAWIGMIVPWISQQRREKKGFRLFIFHHFAGFLACAMLSGAWVFVFRMVGGQELWHEWFWENHVGRLLGTASLSHKRAGAPFYYLKTIAMYGIPWTPLIVIWGARCCRDLWKRRTLSPYRIFLLIWSVGSVLFLSLSVTKRDIYLLPVLPVFAIICAEAFRDELPRWCKTCFSIWVGLCVVLLLAMTLSPLIVRLIPAPDIAAVDFLRVLSIRHIVTSVGAALCLSLIFARDRISIQNRTVAATAILGLGFFILLGKAVDVEKSMRSDIISFIRGIPPGRKPYIAGWNFSETMRGCFYYYGNWSVPLISDSARLRDIVSGDDAEFDSVILSRVRSIPELLEMPYTTLLQASPGGAYDRKRPLIWVEGIRPERRETGESEDNIAK